MIERLIDILLPLARRERVLIGLLVLVILPATIWVLLLEPLGARREQALADLAEARTLNAWVSARADEMVQLDEGGRSGPQPPIGLAALEQSLIDAGLRQAVSGLSNGSDGAIDLRFDEVGFADLMTWATAQEPGWGYTIVSFRIQRTSEAGIVSADFRLAPQG